MTKKRIALLGSTGSIGTQTLDVVERHADLFEVSVLTAGSNVQLLAEQARRFKPRTVVIADAAQHVAVREALADLPIEVLAGEEALSEVVACPWVDTVVVALVGFAGLRPTIQAIRARKHIALANKESLVVAGSIVMRLAAEAQVSIVPIDSEHSAILQSMVGEDRDAVEKVLLTASGGPFRTFSAEQLAGVTPQQALAHPNWHMGAKITIDSATMLNKGFEMIEACWLFGLRPEAVEVVVHPESVVHSAVQFLDGSVKAQLGQPDMRLPIQYALTYPSRLPLSTERLDLFQLGSLHFERPDEGRFPCLALAYEAFRRGGTAPCVLNAAGEVANLAFRQGRIKFLQIADVIEHAMNNMPQDAAPTLDDLYHIDTLTRQHAERFVAQLSV